MMMARVFSFLLLLVAFPIMLLIGLAIKMEYPGPIFYLQKREGKNGVPFFIWKLRTMVVNADVVLAQIIKGDPEKAREWQEFGCLQNDPRVAGLTARLVRQLSIDEVPQLINIFKGEMTFIGPRPLEMYLAESLDTNARSFRNAVRPGLTGLWQVGPRSDVSIRQMQFYDRYYIKKKSFLLDTYIIYKTAQVILKRTGN
ncbi:sugar transferase [Mucilaginibacter agri]|uniref:Sugar transferase n=1 Tax=Mucilaginibacter agri TaxID=2695265 RepID=A0A965ZME4_9SPHI|nr:sugar transferase [Mucilaginibacter agri]NCD72376.1 sugar transferase [Mucilaginibacter agri]